MEIRYINLTTGEVAYAPIDECKQAHKQGVMWLIEGNKVRIERVRGGEVIHTEQWEP